MDAIRAKYTEHGQSQVFKFYDGLDSAGQASLIEQLKGIDPERVNKIFKNAIAESKKREAGTTKVHMEPLPMDCYADTTQEKQIATWNQMGIDAISKGKV